MSAVLGDYTVTDLKVTLSSQQETDFTVAKLSKPLLEVVGGGASLSSESSEVRGRLS